MDHISSVTEEELRALITDGELGGSKRVSREQISQLLAEMAEFSSRAGGSAANTIRGAH